MTMKEFHILLSEFVPEDAGKAQHLIFADYLEERGEYGLAIAIRKHSERMPEWTYNWFIGRDLSGQSKNYNEAIKGKVQWER